MLLKTTDKIIVWIWNKGEGFNPEKLVNGIGLKNIKEKANTLKRKLEIISSLGKSTTIEIVF